MAVQCACVLDSNRHGTGTGTCTERVRTAMRVAHFVQRYPPALGGSEAYFARLSRYLAAAGDEVTVFTTTAVDLEAFWSPRGRCLPAGVTREDGVEVRRYARLALAAAGATCSRRCRCCPQRALAVLTMPCNPIAPAHVARRRPRRRAVRRGPRDGLPLRLADRLRPAAGAAAAACPFVLTPFLHLGDPDDPRDRSRRPTRRRPAVTWSCAADRVFVQTEVERDALLERGIPAEKLVLQGMGVDAGGMHRRRPRTAPRRRGASAPDEVVVGHLANNSVEKGTVDLLRAAERRVATAAAVSTSSWPGRRCRTSGASGTATRRRSA